jgi:hypothetical protein
MGNYVLFPPIVEDGSKARVLIYVRSELAPSVKLKEDIMTANPQTVWIEAKLDLGSITIGGIY